MPTVASTDGVVLAVHDLGGDGPPLLLCHATGFHGRVWSPFAAAMPDRHCWAVDFRGFGDSTAPENEDFAWRGFGDDVLAVIDHLGLDTPVQAVGHSKGGAALLLAEQARPGTFDRLVLFEPIVFPPMDDFSGENPLAASARFRRETFPSYEAAIDNFASKPPLSALRRDALEAYVRHGFAENPDGTVTLKAARDHEALVYEMSHHDGFDRLAHTQVTTLVIGSGDGAGPAVIAPLIADALPHGSFLSMPSLGHFGPLEDPPAVAEVARAFFAG